MSKGLQQFHSVRLLRPAEKIEIDVTNVGDEWCDSQPLGEWFDTQPWPEMEDDIGFAGGLGQPVSTEVTVFDDPPEIEETPTVSKSCHLLKRSKPFDVEPVGEDDLQVTVETKTGPTASDTQPTEPDDSDTPLADMIERIEESSKADDDEVIMTLGLQEAAAEVPGPVSVLSDDNEPEVPAPHAPAPPAPVVPAAIPRPLDPEEKAKLEKKRKVSRDWHAKWIRAGVPRKPKTPSLQHTSDGSSGGGAPDSEVPAPLPKSPAPRPDDQDGDSAAAGAEAAAKAAAAAAPSSFENLSKARDWYITEWISTCGMPRGNERRQAAVEAWMKSDLRSSLVAGRKGMTK